MTRRPHPKASQRGPPTIGVNRFARFLVRPWRPCLVESRRQLRVILSLLFRCVTRSPAAHLWRNHLLRKVRNVRKVLMPTQISTSSLIPSPAASELD